MGSAFEASPVAARRRTNLRTPLTSLVGRADELATLRPLVDRRRLVTLVGPGGVGKTRLALEAAREVFAAGSTDVWLVELADVVDPGGVVSAVASALELPISVDAKLDLARIVDYLCGKGVLVVLDNCEHLVDAAARVTQDLLESCPTLRILATSREGLGVPGEVVWPVPPLTREDAVALFVERGDAAAPTLDLVADAGASSRLLQSICARLDGLPLAIELAASRLGAMPLAEVSAGLRDRFRLLNRGPRTARPRQQTLRAVVDWSYDLLFEDERRVFDRLSVFTGGCALAAARAVCADEEITGDDVAEIMTRLADKSLISLAQVGPGGHVRCRMLQTLVEYGRERLETSGDAERVRAVHARYFCDLTRRGLVALRGEHQRGWLGAITSNMGNLRAVLDAAVAAGDAETAQRIAGSLGWYWWFTGRASEGLRLARPGARLRRRRWRAHPGPPGGVGGLRRGRPDSWCGPNPKKAVRRQPRRSGTSTSPVKRRSRRTGWRGRWTSSSAWRPRSPCAASTRGDHARAQHLLEDAERTLATLDPLPWVAAMREFVGARRAFLEDRHGDADERFRTSIPLFGEIGGAVHSCFAHRYVGRLAALRGDHRASVDAIDAALRLARELGLSGFANVLCTDLSETLSAQGAFEHARRILGRLLDEARDRRAAAGISESLTALAWVEWRAGDEAQAARLAAEVLGTPCGVDRHEPLAHCHAILGLTASRQGDADAARTHHHLALDIGLRSGDARLQALALEGLAAQHVAERDGRLAARLVGAAAALRRSPGTATGWAFAASALVDTDRVIAEATDAIGAPAVAVARASGERDAGTLVARLGDQVAAT